MKENTGRSEILQRLKKSDGWVSGKNIADEFGISRNAVWKFVQKLKKHGYVVRGRRKKGYMFVSTPDKVLPAEILSVPAIQKFIKRVYYFDGIGSTMDIARALAMEGKPEGCLVIAEHQTQGRGRLNRRWVSPSGGIYFSVILRPAMAPSDVPVLNVVASLSVARTLKKLFGLPARVKWPNDVLLSGKKICGALIEMDAEIDSVKWVVLGIGMNVVNYEKVKKAEGGNFRFTSLEKELTAAGLSKGADFLKYIPRVEIVRHVLVEFAGLYGRVCGAGDGRDAVAGKGTSRRINRTAVRNIFKEWESFSDTLGRNVRIMMDGSSITGKAEGLTGSGALVVRTGDGRVEVSAGDCIHIR
ncbi:MAG: biotin--[acetyl-CoA-carboxylase] ligase [Elusimicrobiota bacterium]